MSDGEYEYTSTPYVMYWWDCGACGDTNDARDIEPSGEVDCEFCGETNWIS